MWGMVTRIRWREEISLAGVELYVVGGAFDRGGDPVVATPRQGPFIISTRSGDAVESPVRRKGLLWIGAAVAIAGGGVAVAVSGFLGLVDQGLRSSKSGVHSDFRASGRRQEHHRHREGVGTMLLE